MTVPGPKLLSSEQAKAAFFYGTLMHPKILLRVIGNDGAHLEICSAVLMVSLISKPSRTPMTLIWDGSLGLYETSGQGGAGVPFNT